MQPSGEWWAFTLALASPFSRSFHDQLDSGFGYFLEFSIHWPIRLCLYHGKLYTTLLETGLQQDLSTTCNSYSCGHDRSEMSWIMTTKSPWCELQVVVGWLKLNSNSVKVANELLFYFLCYIIGNIYQFQLFLWPVSLDNLRWNTNKSHNWIGQRKKATQISNWIEFQLQVGKKADSMFSISEEIGFKNWLSYQGSWE